MHMIQTILSSLLLFFIFMGCGGETSTSSIKKETVTQTPKEPIEDADNIFTAGDDQHVLAGEEVVIQSSILDKNKSFKSIVWSENGKILGHEEVLHSSNLSVGEHKITLQMEDSDGKIYTDVIVITIKADNEDNQQPIADDFTITLDEDTDIMTHLRGGDADGDSLHYLFSSRPTHGTLSGSAAHLTYTPAKNYYGKDSFQFKTYDGQIDSRIATVFIVVKPVNDAPVAKIHTDKDSLNQYETITFDANQSYDIDKDDEIQSYSWVVDNNQTYIGKSFKKEFKTVGEHNITLTVEDKNKLSATSTSTITINPTIPLFRLKNVELKENNSTSELIVENEHGSFSYEAINQPLPMWFHLSQTGVFTLSTSGERYESYKEGKRYNSTITVRATDDYSGVYKDKNLTVTIIGKNDAPIASMHFTSTQVMQEETITFTDDSYDIDENDTLTYNWFINSVLTSTKKSFTHTFSTIGEHNIMLTVTDKLGVSDSVSETIMITDGHPYMQLDNIMTQLDEDESISSLPLKVRGGMKPFVFTPVNDIKGWSQKEDGSFSFSTKDSSYQSLKEGEMQTIKIPLKVTGKNNLSQEQNLTFFIMGKNDAPVAYADKNSTDEDNNITFNILKNDIDVDHNHTLTLKEVSTSQGIVTYHQDGNITFSPIGYFDTLKVNQKRDVVLTYILQDEYNATASAQVTITIDGLDDKLDITQPQKQDVYLDGNMVRGKIEALDLDDAITFTDTNSSDGLEIDTTTGSYSFIPPVGMFDYLSKGESIEHNISIMINNKEQNLTFTIIGKNDAPQGVADTNSTLEDTPITLDVLANDKDIDKDILSIYTVTQPTNGTTRISNNKIIYTPKENFFGQDTFSYIPYDNDEKGNTTEVTIIVNPDDDIPKFISHPHITIKRGTTYIYAIQTFDPDSIENVSIANKPTWLTLTNNILTGSAPTIGGMSFGYSSPSSYDINLTVSDGNHTVYQNFTINLTDADNIVPVFNTPSTINTDEDNNSIYGTLTATDSANDRVQFTTDSNLTYFKLDTNGSYELNTTSEFYQALSVDENITTKVRITATDNSGATAEQNLTIIIHGRNDAPTVSEFTLGTNEDESRIFNPLLEIESNIKDIDHDANITITDVNVTKGEISLVENNITFSPQGYFETLKNSTDYETVTINYILQDEHNATTIATMFLRVRGRNDAPQVATFQNITIDENTPKTIDINASDPDGNSLSYESNSSLISFEDNGTYTIRTDGTFEHLADGQSETITILLKVSDTTKTTTQELNVTINGTNDTPIANPDTYNVSEDGYIDMAVLENDSDDDNDTLTIFDISGDNLTLNDKYIHFETFNNFNVLKVGDTKDITFTYKIKDQHGKESQSTSVTLHIDGKDDAPLAEISGSKNIVEGENLTLTAHGTTIDNNTSIKEYSWIVDGEGEVNSQTLTLTPSVGTHHVDLQVKDNRGFLSTVQSVNFTVFELFQQQTVLDTNTSKPISWLELADLDKDGDLDIVVNVLGQDETSEIFWYENQLKGNYKEHKIAAEVSKNSKVVHVADMDDDGWLDVLYAQDYIGICFNTKKREFNCNRTLTSKDRNILYEGGNTNDDINSISTADLDGNGFVDIIITSHRYGDLEFYKQDNKKLFSNYPKILDYQFPAASFVTTAYIDNDGDMDVVASYKDGTQYGVKYYFKKETEGFTKKSVNNTNGANTVSIAQMNNKGGKDVIITYDDAIKWSNATSNGGIVDDNITNPSFASGVDIDNDGDIDVLSNSNEKNGKILWYESKIDEDNQVTFTKHTIEDSIDNITITQAGDIDNDGDIDIVSADKNGKIYIYENNKGN